MRHLSVVPIFLAALTAASPQFGEQSPTRPVVVSDKPSGIYALGDTARWTVSLPNGAATPTGKYAYTVKRNNQDQIKAGELDLSSGKATIEVKLDEPAMLYMRLTPPGGGRGWVFGAAFAPRKLRPVMPRPRDFDEFWKSKIELLHTVPMNPVLTSGESDRPGVEYSTIQMDHVNGTHVYGQLAKPAKDGKYPAILILQWASPPYPLQKPWVTDLASKGWLALNIEPHDVLATAAPAYYQGLPNAIKNYASIGQDDRDKSYFVEMYLRDFRAVDFLTQHPNWDGKTLVVMGTSMGGQQSFAVAGLHPKVTHLIVEVPAGSDLGAPLHGRQIGYPNFPVNNPKVMEAARYVDCVNFAPHIRATCLVGMGFVDTVAPPAGIWTTFNLIRGRKEAAPMVDAPHNNTATREQQLPYTTRASAWLDALVKGERAPVNASAGNP